MKVVTASEMRNIDKISIEEIGIPSLVLMERAGLSVIKRIKERFPQDKSIVIVAGGGNNGGDGLVIARNLFNEGRNVIVYLLSSIDKLSKDCFHQFKICEKLRVPIKIEERPDKKELKNKIVVDAIIGTGLNKIIKQEIATIIEIVNSSDTSVVSVDIPTGVSSDTGEIMGNAIKASLTVTFGLPKIGHVLYPGKSLTGDLFIEDIGFPKWLLESDNLKNELVCKNNLKLPQRKPDAHKGIFGHVLVIGGSIGKTGAIRLSAKAALKAGAGLVTIAAPEVVINSLMASVVEEMTLPLKGSGTGIISIKALKQVLDFLEKKANVLAIGPGMGRDKEVIEFVINVIRNIYIPIVIDADGLYALKGKEEIIKEIKAPLILTPHPGEMGYLIDKTPKEINKNRIEVARNFATQTGTYLILKGAPTVIAEPNGYCYINTTGNSAIATAGSGDVLTGIVAAMLAQGLSPLQASITAVWLHGIAGDIASERLTHYSTIASDIIKFLPEAFKRF